MAQNVTVAGATYSAVPSVNLPKQGGGTASFFDVSDTTAAAADVASGKYFYTASGVRTVGTASGGGGLQVATATKTLSAASSSIAFTGLNGEPSSFAVISEDDLATGGSKAAIVVFDGTGIDAQTVTTQAVHDGSGFTKSFSSGTLTVTSTGAQFQPVTYLLVYTHGGTPANIGTSDVQVGSGATSISFSGLAEEPACWYLVFKSDFSTSSGYQRVMGVVNDGSSTRGMAMDSAGRALSSWTASYSAGTLTVSSQGTNSGGYFHQPGNYHLVYATGGTVEVEVGPLTVTANGVYSEAGKAYSPVTVNVSGGSSMNVQVAQSTTRIASTAYTETASLTCSVAGKYDVYWDCYRSSTSGTNGSQLYIAGSAYGTANTTFSNNIQTNHLTGVTLAANQEVAVYVRSRGTSYYAYCGTLVIKQTS